MPVASKVQDRSPLSVLTSSSAPSFAHSLPLSPGERQSFRDALLAWYRRNARDFPWRGIDDPYGTWVSEIMLQQTRVDAVIGHYRRFLQRYPTLLTLALAPEDDVLALWSGLGYYRRARMLHRAARFVVAEHGGSLPHTAAELRSLPGIGAYTSAAIASIAFGEPVAVVDGNVERVLLRVAGQGEQSGAHASAFVASFAQAVLDTTAPGDSNQAIMELGATVCLPRGPLCLQCPVFDWCRTRGEHTTLPRAAMRSAHVGYALTERAAPSSSDLPDLVTSSQTLLEQRTCEPQILLHRRGADLSLMAGMLELPPLRTLPAVAPRLRLRHGITGTNYYVEVFDISSELEVTSGMRPLPSREDETGEVHPDLYPAADQVPSLQWFPVGRLPALPLTGLARKVLQRTGHLFTPVRHSARNLQSQVQA